jgi:hypothetical protein
MRSFLDLNTILYIHFEQWSSAETRIQKPLDGMHRQQWQTL